MGGLMDIELREALESELRQLRSEMADLPTKQARALAEVLTSFRVEVGSQNG